MKMVNKKKKIIKFQVITGYEYMSRVGGRGSRSTSTAHLLCDTVYIEVIGREGETGGGGRQSNIYLTKV